MTDCKHDWHFVKGLTERLRCTRCGQMTWPKSVEERTRELLEDALTIGSAWSKDGERIDPTSVYKDFEPWTTEQVTVPTDQLYAFGPLKPDYNITFHNNHDTSGAGKQVGKLDFNGPELVFEGDAAESAKVFIDWIATAFKGRLEEERQAELKACCDLLEGMHIATDGNHNYYLYAAVELRKLRGRT